MPTSAFADQLDKISADQGNELQLSGLLKSESQWGPPGFGETPEVDIKWTAWLLVLKKPAIFFHKGDNGKNIQEVLTCVQINGFKSPAFEEQLRRVMGRQIIVSGEVWSASTPGDITPVIVIMSSIKLVEK